MKKILKLWASILKEEIDTISAHRKEMRLKYPKLFKDHREKDL